MGDVLCGKCGEPWDFYGLLHGDVSKIEGQRILNGEGCPSCKWGKDAEPTTTCKWCCGSGMSTDRVHDCDYCNGVGERNIGPSELMLDRIRSIDDGTDLDPFEFM